MAEETLKNLILEVYCGLAVKPIEKRTAPVATDLVRFKSSFLRPFRISIDF